MRRNLIVGVLLAAFCIAAASAQAPAPPDFSGAWTTFRGGQGAGAFSAPQGEIKLTKAAEAARQDYLSVTKGTNHGPGNSCVGYGMPASVLGSGGYPMEIIQRPDQLFVIYEAHSEIRRIFIGARAGDPSQFFPERNGYSKARWEGNRLIVETTRLKTQVDTRYPHSDQASIREVYYFDKPLADGTKVLVNELTMTDPAWLAEPFTTVKRWQELKDYHVLTYECAEPKWLDELEELYQKAKLKVVQQ
jgi:hypothetical protein